MNKVFDADKIWAYLIVSSIGFLEPLGVLMIWFLIFVACDMVTGITASVKERQIITSHGLQRTVVKFLMYAMTIVLLNAIDVYMLVVAHLGLAKIGATIICGIELYSILENCYRITGNKVFKVLTQFTLKKIEDSTGVDINDKL
ncbi:MAG: phage holin family protein [Alphaproteobacteria bacterium]|nr:phage holin family protein [Alphaproteobacteria bacterium]